MTTPILLIAFLRRFAALGSFFAIADGVHAIGTYAQGDQIILDRIGTAVSQPQVVLFASSLVTMTFYAELKGGIGL
jgi:hypothetical protein